MNIERSAGLPFAAAPWLGDDREIPMTLFAVVISFALLVPFYYTNTAIFGALTDQPLLLSSKPDSLSMGIALPQNNRI